ncbi:MAG TPA: enoyl-CoA hydratase/isomerase family protein [Caulobacteraceae bacterium]|nr:enoyl-CoA hydratase/isomerase family protein [Caulobacteraceae bacterium]
MDQTLIDRPVRTVRRDAGYFGRFECLRLSRTWDGVLVARLGGAGGALAFAPRAYDELLDAFRRIRRDPRNRAVVLTGVGGDFIAGFAAGRRGARWRRSGGIRPVLSALAALDVPLIAAVEGRAHAHPEIALLADLVVAGDQAVFQRPRSGDPAEIDAVRDLWRHRVGRLRADAFLVHPLPLSASRAAAWGLVDELTANGGALARAIELARLYLAAPDHVRRGLRADAASSLRGALSLTEHEPFGSLARQSDVRLVA